METDPLLRNKEHRPSAALLARAVGCVGSVAEGYDMGCLGTIVADVRDDLGLSPRDVGLLASLPHCCFALAALGGGALADRCGRKGAIVATCLALLAGTCTQVAAPGLWWLLAGRAVVNAGAGSGVVAVSAYLTEVAPAESRGLFVSLEELCYNFGLLAAYFANWCLDGRRDGWRLVVGIGALWPAAALGLCLLPQVPESPRYLLLCGRRREAELVLRRLLREPEEIQEALAAWEADGRPSPGAAARHAPRAALVASVGLAACAGLGGVLAVNPLLSYVLSAAGGESARISSWALAIAVAKFLLLLPVCLCLIDRAGRRPLLLASALGMSGGCALAAAALAGHLPAALAFVGIAAHLIFYSLGVGPVMWAYCAEVLPTSFRGPGMGVAVMVSRAISSVQLFLLPLAMEACRWAPFLFYAAANLGTALFVARACPETRGGDLEGLRGLFKA